MENLKEILYNNAKINSCEHIITTYPFLEKTILEAMNQALRVHDVSVAKRKLCPTCGSDSLITLSDIIYCMNDCCDGVKGHN